MHYPCDKAKQYGKAYRARSGVSNEIKLLKCKPYEQREHRHAAEKVSGDERRLEQHRHCPHAERRLEHYEEDERGGQRAGLPFSQGHEEDEKEQKTQGRGQITVAHLRPCLGMREVVGHLRGNGLTVAERPVRAAQAGIGEPHVRADDNHHEGERERREYESAIVAHPIRRNESTAARITASAASEYHCSA